jgi:protein involved in polysaccharide export with SLBB domain
MKLAVIFAAILCLFVSGIGWAGDQPDRIVKPGDKLRLTCVEEPQLNNTYTVTKDGLIVLPFVGAIEVKNITVQEAAVKIATELMQQRILRSATVGLEFDAPAAVGIQYSGAVEASGTFPFAEGLRLSDVLRVARLRSDADISRVEVISFNGKRTSVKFVDDPAAPLENNPYLKAGDQIVVPAIARPENIFILGGVRNPGLRPMRTGMTLRSAIEDAGGFDVTGDPRRVRLEREKQPAIIYDLGDANRDVTLQGGDRIVVELRPTRQYVTVMGFVSRPGAVEYRDGMTLMQALNDAGGVRDDVPVERVAVYNSKSDFRAPAIYNLQRIVQGFLGDVMLEPGDRVEAVRQGQRRPAGIAVFLAAAAAMLYFGR